MAMTQKILKKKKKKIMNDLFEKKYRELLIIYKLENSIELPNGKCICKKCKKLFRTSEFLKIHFDSIHFLDLKEIEKKSKL